jgi:flavin reductase (DIM6/NTAB) family NADH-FMN oxidoreductase RutF
MQMLPSEYYTYEPCKGHGLKYNPFNAIIGPRPIGWIASLNKAGQRNLAPYSFFNAFNYIPPIIGFCSVGHKDSVRNIQATGEFVWNLVTRPLAEAMNSSAASVPSGVDEFELSGLTPVASRKVKPPRVGESRVAMECKLSQVLQLQSAAGEAIESWLVLGEVVMVHIDRTLLKDGIYDTAAAHPILRAGGPSSYAEIRPENMFEVIRPA